MRFVIHYVRSRKHPVGSLPLDRQRAIGEAAYQSGAHKPGLEVNVANGPNAPRRAFTFASGCPLNTLMIAPKPLQRKARQAQIGDLVEDRLTGEWFATTTEGVVRVGRKRPLKRFGHLAKKTTVLLEPLKQAA
jgi:hypothetical protein